MKSIAYSGAFDDFALRYRLPGSCGNEVQQLNTMLVAQAFTGVPLAVNDGYFVNHPAIRAAVVKPDSSPLCEFTESSFITVLSRNDKKLESLADDMAGNGITSAMDLVVSPFYASDLRPRLREWAPTLRSSACNAFRPWPTLNMEVVFYRTLGMGFESYLEFKAQDDRIALSDYWWEFAAGEKKRRTEWEEQALRWKVGEKLPDGAFEELMSLGNQAYQYAWACALALSQSESSRYRVETNASPHFVRLHETADLDLEMPRKNVVLEVPILNSEYAAKVVSGRWQLLAEMLRDGHRVNIAKYEFLDRLTEFREGRCSEPDMDEATRHYSSRLSEHFKEPVAWAPLTFDLAVLTGSTTVGLALGGLPGAVVGFGISLTGVAAAHGWPGPKLFGMVATPGRKDWFASLSRTALGTVSASFEVDQGKAASVLKDVPKFDGS